MWLTAQAIRAFKLAVKKVGDSEDYHNLGVLLESCYVCILLPIMWALAGSRWYRFEWQNVTVKICVFSYTGIAYMRIGHEQQDKVC